MNLKQLAIGTVVGAITLLVVGFLLFGVILANFYVENTGFAVDAFRAGMVEWAFILSSVPFSLLITLCILRQPGTATLRQGFQAGAVIGFLIWLGTDLTTYSLTHLWTLTIVIVDPIVAAFQNGVAGTAIALALSKVSSQLGG